MDRFAKMFAWGFLFYGPYQHVWYRKLAAVFPGKSAGAFMAKVAANQFVLAPVVLTSVFSWNLLLQSPPKTAEIVPKIQKDLWPTMVRGWGFWVPAASINFWFVPLQNQVLYMSSCGLVWTTYLSFTSYVSLATLLESLAAPAEKKEDSKGKKKGGKGK